jgi:hypothetical protein
VIVFVEFLPVIASFLDAETSLEPKAGLLLSAIREPRFLVGLVAAEYVLSHTVGPSKELQSTHGNLVSAYQTIEEVKKVFAHSRENAEAEFKDLFGKAQGLLEEVGSSHETIPVPRVCARQTQRGNVPFDTAEEYYRRSVFIPFVDEVIAELRSRFEDASVPRAYHISELLKGADMSVPSFLDAAALYEGDTDCFSLLKAEVKRWKSSTTSFKSLKEAYQHATKRSFPNLQTLLSILLTIPVTNAEAERSFSALKRLKSYLRSTMGQERLNGLALLAVHSEIRISPEKVIDDFAKSNRKLLLH